MAWSQMSLSFGRTIDCRLHDVLVLRMVQVCKRWHLYASFLSLDYLFHLLPRVFLFCQLYSLYKTRFFYEQTKKSTNAYRTVSAYVS